MFKATQAALSTGMVAQTSRANIRSQEVPQNLTASALNWAEDSAADSHPKLGRNRSTRVRGYVRDLVPNERAEFAPHRKSVRAHLAQRDNNRGRVA